MFQGFWNLISSHAIRLVKGELFGANVKLAVTLLSVNVYC